MSASVISNGVSTTSQISSQKMELIGVGKKEWAYSRVELYIDDLILTPDKISPSPSEKDGLDPMSEYDLRYIGCELIQTAGILLKLPQVAMATAQVLFQRFFYFKSFVNNPMEIFAMASLVLASKIEEAIRRNRDIINVFHYLKYKRANLDPEPLMLDQNYQYIKSQVIKAERKLLRELGFCVHVKHPHKLITCFLQALGCQRRRVLQTAWNYMNDGLRTNIFVRYTPDTIACACIYLSARQHKVVFPTEPPWFEVFKCREEQLKDIALNIMYVYVHQAQSQSELEQKIQRLKDQLVEAKNKAKSAAAAINLNNLADTVASINNNNNNPYRLGAGGTASNSHSPANSKNSSPVGKDRKERERKRSSRSQSDSADSDTHISRSSSAYHRHSSSSHKHQKRKHKDNAHSRHNNHDAASRNPNRGPEKSRRHKQKISSPTVLASENGYSPKRLRKNSAVSSGEEATSPSTDCRPKKHKRKSSRDKHKKSHHKTEYKERGSRYY